MRPVALAQRNRKNGSGSGRFPAGVWWVDLSPVRSPEPVAAEVAAPLGVAPGAGDLVGLVVEQLAMANNGTLDKTAAAKLPPVSGTPIFLSQKQATDAATYLSANWQKAIS